LWEPWVKNHGQVIVSVSNLFLQWHETETVRVAVALSPGDPTQDIVSAVKEHWTGQIVLADPEGPVGQIVFIRGQIGWATCRHQPETLGMFLWRLGRITRAQLARVQQLYLEHQGKKKLGALLEESGFMSVPVLRRCLLLHTRSAIESLLSLAGLDASRTGLPDAGEERILFEPWEVLPRLISARLGLPQSQGHAARERRWFTLNRENVGLNAFVDLPGYLASAVLSFDGDVVAAHLESGEVDLSSLAVYVSTLLESSLRAAHSVNWSGVCSVVVECPQGWLAARWLDSDRYYLVVVLIDEQGDPALTQRTVESMLAPLHDWLVPPEEAAASGGNGLR
jgi:hypothetical protein